jgi:hypothetical protein
MPAFATSLQLEASFARKGARETVRATYKEKSTVSHQSTVRLEAPWLLLPSPFSS